MTRMTGPGLRGYVQFNKYTYVHTHILHTTYIYVMLMLLVVVSHSNNTVVSRVVLSGFQGCVVQKNNANVVIFLILTLRRYFQHAHFIPIGEREAHVNWYMVLFF